MRCVPEAVNKLFPNIDLSRFSARDCGYGLGDIQRMLPYEFSIWPVYTSHRKAKNGDVLKAFEKSFNWIPLFLFTKHHCIFALWDRKNIIIEDKSIDKYWDATEFFNRNKILQVAAVVRYEDYKLLEIEK